MASRFKSLHEWLAWLESSHAKPIDLGLDRVRVVAQTLQVLSPRATVVTVAGTNGKGSFVAALSRFLEVNGKTYGAYTSPHIEYYGERICINGEPVSAEDICQAFQRIDQARGDISLTYFEFGTLAAMLIFNQTPLDVWILEVGLGGRLDAVNVVDPDIAVVTSIALDHQDWLGSDRETIALEKAGIFRPGIPIVCVDKAPPKSLLESMAQSGGDAFVWGRDIHYHEHLSSGEGSLGFDYHVIQTVDKGPYQERIYTRLPMPDLPMPSVLAALQTCCLLGVPLTDEQAHQTIPTLNLRGRFQRFILSDHVELVMDVAHNPAATQLLAERLANIDARIYAVVSMMADKDMEGSLSPLLSHIDRWYVTGVSGNERSAKPEILKSALLHAFKSAAKSEIYPGSDASVMMCSTIASSLDLACEQACQEKAGPVVLLAMGSFLTVEGALQWVKDKNPCESTHAQSIELS